MNDTQSQELKQELSTIREDETWKEIKTLLSSIENQIANKDDLKFFLEECGLSVGHNLSVGMIFILLQYLLMG